MTGRMTGEGERGAHGQPAEQGRVAEPEWRRRRRLAEVFGEGLPESTRDDRDEDVAGGRRRETAGDAWLRAQVPPHHG